MKNDKVIIIVPAYNEEESILRVGKSLQELRGIDFIIINDGSTDKTVHICETNNLPHINLIHNLGIGGAMQTGYKYAYENGYDIAVQFDGDGQHNSEYIPILIKPILSNKNDFVIGSRFIQSSQEGFKSTKMRRLGIKIISFTIKLVTGRTIFDPTSGFRACNRKIIKFFANNYPTEYPEPESITKLLRNNFSVKEIPVKMNERKTGTSSIKRWKNVYYMINVCLSILIEGIRKNGTSS